MLSNSIFIANFLWTAYSGIPLFGSYERWLNIWNSLYRDGQYDLASTLYEATAQDYPKSFELSYNKANTAYKLWKLESAIEHYESALEISPDPEAQKNLEFVKSQLQKQQESQQESEQGQQPQWDENQDQEPESSDSQQKQEESWQESWQENQQNQNWESELSEQTQAILEKRSKNLEEAQGEFKKYYNKNYKQDNSKTLLERVFNNSLLEQTWEKDW